MKTLVTVLLTALFVFALATAWVDYVQPQLAQSVIATAEKPSPAPTPSAKRRPRKKVASVAPVELMPSTDEEALEDEITAVPQQLPKTVPQSSESAELLAKRLDEVKEQESTLASRQEALRMIYEDIRTELATVDQLRKQTTDELAEAERRILDVAQRKSTQPSKPGRSFPPARTAGESPSIRGEALFIRRLVDDGKMETAVSVLRAMKGRDAASVLESLSSLDSRLAERLADAVPGHSDDTVRR